MKKIYCAVSRCLSCRSCEIACAVEHSKSKKIGLAIREKPRPLNRRELTAVDRGKKSAVISTACNHCEEALCVRACMSGAMYKAEDGSTQHDESKCVGCWMCVMVCPFGAISRKEKLALKCDLCRGREKGPACVERCPTGSLAFIEEVAT